VTELVINYNTSQLMSNAAWQSMLQG